MIVTSHYGQVLRSESRAVAQFANGDVATQITHSNLIRIRWSSGKENHGSWKVNADPGDVIMAIYADGKCIGESNITTGQVVIYQVKYEEGCLNYMIAFATIFLCLFGIGFLLLIFFYFKWRSKKSRYHAAVRSEIQRVVQSADFKSYMDSLGPSVRPAS